MGEEFVFLAGSFDFRLPLFGRKAFQFHEVGHVVAGIGESRNGFFLQFRRSG